jgi:hypothetical protein
VLGKKVLEVRLVCKLLICIIAHFTLDWVWDCCAFAVALPPLFARSSHVLVRHGCKEIDIFPSARLQSIRVGTRDASQRSSRMVCVYLLVGRSHSDDYADHSPLAVPFRADEDHPDPDGSEPDLHLSITPALLSAFQSSLVQHHIDLRFFSGSWDGFNVERILSGSNTYDIVLTSETIYRTDSTPALLRLLRDACLGTSTSHAPMQETLDGSARYTCLVAAKVLYFGVGGGVAEFVEEIEKNGYGKADSVWEQTAGVGRRILNVSWTR